MIRILIVDDDQAGCKLMQMALSGMELEIATAANTTEALMSLRCGPRVDLVITDLYLPGMELLGILRREFLGLRLIAISAHFERLAEAQSRGADALLRKPFKRHELVEMVQILLAPLQLT